MGHLGPFMYRLNYGGHHLKEMFERNDKIDFFSLDIDIAIAVLLNIRWRYFNLIAPIMV